MTAFEKWLGRANLFYHQYEKLLEAHLAFPHHAEKPILPIVNYDNDLRKAYEAGVRQGKRDADLKKSKSPNYYGTFLEEEA